MRRATSGTGRKSSRKSGPSQQTITRRGLRICQKGGQIKTLGDDRWDVASQSAEDEWYRVSFGCNSPTCERICHATGRGRGRERTAAVERPLAISSKPAPRGREAIGERESRRPDCGLKDPNFDGVYRGRYEDVQRYGRPRGRRFRDNLGVEYRQIPRKFITAILMQSGAGASVANIQALLAHFGIEVHTDAITRDIAHYSRMVEGYVETIKPPSPGEKRGRGEKHRKVRGKECGSSR